MLPFKTALSGETPKITRAQVPQQTSCMPFAYFVFGLCMLTLYELEARFPCHNVNVCHIILKNNYCEKSSKFFSKLENVPTYSTCMV